MLINILYRIISAICIRTDIIVLLAERVNAGPHGYAGHVIPSGAEVVHVQAVQPVQLLAREAEGVRGAAGQQGGVLHSHLAAEGVVVDSLPDAVVAADHHPRAAQMVGDVVVSAGRGAVGIQVHIAASELPQQRCAAAQHQAVDVSVFDQYEPIGAAPGRDV